MQTSFDDQASYAMANDDNEDLILCKLSCGYVKYRVNGIL